MILLENKKSIIIGGDVIVKNITPLGSYNNSITTWVASADHANPRICGTELKNSVYTMKYRSASQSKTYLVPQCAAPNTHLSLRRVPPQNMLADDVEEDLERPTCHPTSPLLAFSPPTTLVDFLLFAIS